MDCDCGALAGRDDIQHVLAPLCPPMDDTLVGSPILTQRVDFLLYFFCGETDWSVGEGWLVAFSSASVAEETLFLFLKVLGCDQREVLAAQYLTDVGLDCSYTHVRHSRIDMVFVW